LADGRPAAGETASTAGRISGEAIGKAHPGERLRWGREMTGAGTEEFGMKLEPIGVVHSGFTSQEGTPVQPAFASLEDTGAVEVYEAYAEGLEDLERFDRIWLICWFHRSSPPRMKVIPYLDTRERGLFATRAPSRPNPIGISAVRLVRREGRFLHVAELDVLDGTPLLDIKPYSAHVDVFPVGEEGWLGERVRGRIEADERFGENT
jgi:tRNA-Thr(GGU) m(6)t(6)A37 methyltransferase TsaA